VAGSFNVNAYQRDLKLGSDLVVVATFIMCEYYVLTPCLVMLLVNPCKAVKLFAKFNAPRQLKPTVL
jgi:hypothetical protein